MNPCENETEGSRQAGIQYVCTAINKGRWATEAKEYSKREGLAIDFSNRPNETWWDDAMRRHPSLRFLERLKKAASNPKLALSRVKQRFGEAGEIPFAIDG